MICVPLRGGILNSFRWDRLVGLHCTSNWLKNWLKRIVDPFVKGGQQPSGILGSPSSQFCPSMLLQSMLLSLMLLAYFKTCRNSQLNTNTRKIWTDFFVKDKEGGDAQPAGWPTWSLLIFLHQQQNLRAMTNTVLVLHRKWTQCKRLKQEWTQTGVGT